jgi:hypothetical protein
VVGAFDVGEGGGAGCSDAVGDACRVENVAVVPVRRVGRVGGSGGGGGGGGGEMAAIVDVVVERLS